MSRATRPLMELDAQGRVLPDSNTYLTHRMQYSGSNITYHGVARPGTAETDASWQIVQLNYSGNNLVSVLYPQNTLSKASSEFEFQWSARVGYTYS